MKNNFFIYCCMLSILTLLALSNYSSWVFNITQGLLVFRSLLLIFLPKEQLQGSQENMYLSGLLVIAVIASTWYWIAVFVLLGEIMLHNKLAVKVKGNKFM